MANQNAKQDDNQVWGLIAHSGTAASAQTMKVGATAGALWVLLYAEDANSPGIYRPIQGAYNTNNQFTLLTSAGTIGGTTVGPVSLQYMGMFGPYTYPI